jgi:hypothetical protein
MTVIETNCPACHKVILIKQPRADRKATCPECRKQFVMHWYNDPIDSGPIEAGIAGLKTVFDDGSDVPQSLDTHVSDQRHGKDYSGLTLVSGLMSILGALILVAGLAIATFGGVWISTGKITTEGVALLMGGIAYFTIGLLTIGAAEALRVLRDIAFNISRLND